MDTHYKIDRIWEYSHYYGDMLFSAKRLYDSEEPYAAVMILFNATELLLKSVRENYSKTFSEDIALLGKQGILTEEEQNYLNDEMGIKKIRNIMTHRNAYQYCLESLDGKAFMFSDTETWSIIFALHFDNIVEILYNAVNKSALLE
jgi:hypothetical protein